MTFDPDRRPDLDDPIRRRVADGDGIGFLPMILGLVLLFGFGYFLIATWDSSGTSTTRESNVRTERPVTTPAPSVTPTPAPAPAPQAPN